MHDLQQNNSEIPRLFRQKLHSLPVSLMACILATHKMVARLKLMITRKSQNLFFRQRDVHGEFQNLPFSENDFENMDCEKGGCRYKHWL